MGKQIHLLAFALFLTSSSFLFGQVALTLQYDPGQETYMVFARSQTDWLSPVDNVVHSGRVTLVAPTGSLQPEDLQSQLGLWELTQVISKPSENPGADYLVFDLIGTALNTEFLAGQETPLFSFKNLFGCNGNLELMDPGSDPFAPPNSLNIPVGQSLVVEGAGGEAYTENYNAGPVSCPCHFLYSLTLLPDGFYELSLSSTLPASFNAQSLRMSLKVPGHLFTLYNLQNLQPSTLTFAGISRNEAPAEAPGFDYIQISMEALNGQTLSVGPGDQIPLIKFANGGSCEGDSIYLVAQGDPFLPPNSQGADIGQSLQSAGSPIREGVCPSGTGAALCKGCLFTADVIEVDEVRFENPVSCLGGNNGVITLLANGAEDLAFSLDNGATWTTDPSFEGLQAGTYLPRIRGNHLGCAVEKAADEVELKDTSVLDLQVEVPEKVCTGGDLALRAMTPGPLPPNTVYQWMGPLGFSSDLPDPVLFNTNVFQSGTYALTVMAPGCDPATAAGETKVFPSAETPLLVTNAPFCRGDELVLSTDVPAEKYEWLGPAGQSAVTLSLPGLTTQNDTTVIPAGHPAYQAGTWRVRITDENGCVAESEQKTITIKSRPQAFAANSGPVCPGKDAQLTANLLPGATYRWRKAGDTSLFSLQADPVIPQVTSQTTYELEVELDGCVSENAASTTIALHPKPSAFPAFTYQVAPDCSPRDVQLTANGSGTGLEYRWSGANGFLSFVENPVISNAGSLYNGGYQLEVTNLFGCSTTSPFEITGIVDEVPVPVVQSTGAVCPGGNILLSAQSYDLAQVSYQWYRNGDKIPGAVSNTLALNAVQPADAGTYQVEVQAGACKLVSAGQSVSILPGPAVEPSFVLTFPCEGSSLQFFSNTDGIVAWNWSGPGGFSSQAAFPLIYNTEFDDIGSYSLTVTGQNGCTAAGSVVVDGILPVPDAPQVATNSPVCPEEKISLVVQNPVVMGTVYYDWINGMGDHLGDGEPTLELDPSDPLSVPPFLVKIIVNGCESDWSDPVAVDVIPSPLADAGNSGAVCPGESVQLFAAPVASGVYAWRRAGEAQVLSYEQNPLLPLTDSTTFELTVQITGCQATATDQTTVMPLGVPVITNLSGGGVRCEGTSVVLSGQNTVSFSGNITFEWTGPSGFYYTGTAAPSGPFETTIGVMQPQNEGTYTLVLTSPEGCSSTPKSLALDYVAMPAPPVLTVADDTLCEGETLQLDVSPYAGDEVKYAWYIDNGSVDSLLAVTAFPTYILQNITPWYEGVYYVEATVDGCQPPPSNLETLTVQGTGINLQTVNSTTATDPACEGEDVQLEAEWIPGASYAWYGPAGFQATANSATLPSVSVNQAGNYQVQVTLSGCATYIQSLTEVFVNPLPETPALNVAPEVCAGAEVGFSITNPAPGTIYQWYFSVNQILIGAGSDPVFVLDDVIPGQSGTYYALAVQDGCLSPASSPVNLMVVPEEQVSAYAGTDQVVCTEAEPVYLQANEPSVGQGYWKSVGAGKAIQPDQPLTGVTGLQPGSNLLVWEIAHPVCGQFSSDTTEVFLEKLDAVADNWSLAWNDTLATFDLLANDQAGSVIAWDVSLFEQPEKGRAWVNADGWARYIPYPEVFGEDRFRYQLCSMTCPDLCDTAVVRLTMESGPGASGCFVPNLITPDGDGANDVFIIPCAVMYPGSSLVIFNRYGSKVYASEDYRNDWDGTYDGEPLPAGTYFYRAELQDEKRTALQGYVVVVR